MTVTREELLVRVAAAVQPVTSWYDRKDPGRATDLGELWALLTAGCPFVVEYQDEQMIVTVTYPGFHKLEMGDRSLPDEEDMYVVPIGNS